MPRGVSRDLHQTLKEYPLMNLAAIFPRRKVSPTQYLSLQLLNFQHYVFWQLSLGLIFC